ncbi:MAG: hypothetical protein IIT49_02210 [Clostridia bacterium]|nr:hypothetical protein [Clostridia bacterium]
MQTHLHSYPSISLAVRYIIVLAAGLAAGFALPEIISRIPVIRFLVMGIRKPKKAVTEKAANQAYK